MNDKKIRIASFDIGKKNFAQYIEEVDLSTIKSLGKEYDSLPQKLKRRVKGPMNCKIEEMLIKLFSSSTKIQTGVYDLRHNKDSKSLDLETRKNLLAHLESFEYLWRTCDFFIIEQQFYKKRGGRFSKVEANMDAIKLAEATLIWFMSEYPFAKTMYFGSENKTQILGAPPKLTKPQRKKWASEKCREIYEMREDYGMVELFKLKDLVFRKRLDTENKVRFYLEKYPEDCPKDCQELAKRLIREKQKLDDIGDACIQAQAFKFRHMIALF